MTASSSGYCSYFTHGTNKVGRAGLMHEPFIRSQIAIGHYGEAKQRELRLPIPDKIQNFSKFLFAKF